MNEQQNAAEKVKRDKTTLRLSVAGIVVVILLTFLFTPPSSESVRTVETGGQSKRDYYTSIITLTTGWHEVAVPVGMTIRFLPTGKDVAWEVMVNGDESRIFRRPPINSPDFREIDYGSRMRFVAWRVSPGQAQTSCELAYSFSPLRN